MSLTKLREIQCDCGEMFTAEIYGSINIGQNPELKELLLAGELNVVSCNKCGNIIFVEDFLLYLDLKQEIIAFVYPLELKKQKETYEQSMAENFRIVQKDMNKKFDYKPMLLFGLEELIEILNAELELEDETQILEYMVNEFKMSSIKLSIRSSRKLKLPGIIPYIPDKKHGMKQQIISGLQKIINFSPDMINCKKLLDKINTDTTFNIEELLDKIKK